MAAAYPASSDSPVTAGNQHTRQPSRLLTGLLCAAIVATYALIGSFDDWHSGAAPRDAFYNSLVRGFAAGQLNLKTDPPPGLLALPNPYDPVRNEPFRATIHDTSLYHGKLYLYFGPTPAVLLFGPWRAVTGGYLPHHVAVIVFCSAGFVLNVLLLAQVRRRYFSTAPVGVQLAAIVLIGLTGMPILLGRADTWEVPISSGYFLLSAGVFSLWRGLHNPKRLVGWTALASAAFGLALGARPSLLVGAPILLLPLRFLRRTAPPLAASVRLLVATFGPITACGLALLAYNYLRFDRPLEFGQRYQLAGDTTTTVALFSSRYLWTNLYAYFAAPAAWVPFFPFIEHTKILPTDGHLAIEGTFGILLNVPIVWMAGFTAFAASRRIGPWGNPPLRLWTAAPVGLFVATAGVVLFFAGACDRYEIEFLPPLLLIAALGLFTVETTALPAIRPTLVRAIWVVLLVVSVGFSLLASYRLSADTELRQALRSAEAGRTDDAARHYQRLLKLRPASVSGHYNYGLLLASYGHTAEALEHFEIAARVAPKLAAAQSAYGEVLVATGKLADGRAHIEAALRLDPDFAGAHQALGRVLLRLGDRTGAHRELTRAAQLDPSLPGLQAELAAAAGRP